MKIYHFTPDEPPQSAEFASIKVAPSLPGSEKSNLKRSVHALRDLNRPYRAICLSIQNQSVKHATWSSLSQRTLWITIVSDWTWHYQNQAAYQCFPLLTWTSLSNGRLYASTTFNKCRCRLCPNGFILLLADFVNRFFCVAFTKAFSKNLIPTIIHFT